MRSLGESLHFARPPTSTAVDNVDLERSIGSEVSVGVYMEDQARRENPKPSSGSRKTELDQVA